MPDGTFTYRRREPEAGDLHRVVRTWLASAEALMAERLGEDVRLPAFVHKAIAKYLDCGQLAKGFVRVRCDDCGDDRLIAFSCKVRGLCPSCDGRRMADEGAHLVDNVLPVAPYRQWVLTFPFWLRYRLAWDQSLREAVLKIFVGVVSQFYVKRAAATGIRDAKAGAISVLHRFDSGLKSDVHWHILFADGVWAPTTERAPTEPGPIAFFAAKPLHEDDVPTVLAAIHRRVWKLLDRRKILHDDVEAGEVPDEFAALEPAMAAVLKASLLGLSVVEPGTGPRQQRERGPKPDVVHRRGRHCADLGQFSLHANTRIGELARVGLENMVRYLCRPALAAGRVELLENDTVVRLRLKSPWKDGTTHILLASADFVLRLCALIPLPRRATLHYHGVFAPASQLRRQIVRHTARPRVKKLPKPTPDPADATVAELQALKEALLKPAPSRMSMAELFRRVFKFEILDCACGGRRRVIATIPEGSIATRILEHLGLPTTAVGALPIRAPPGDDFGWAYAMNDDTDAIDEAPPDDLPFFDAVA